MAQAAGSLVITLCCVFLSSHIGGPEAPPVLVTTRFTSHFTDEKTNTEQLSDFPGLSGLISGQARAWVRCPEPAR